MTKQTEWEYQVRWFTVSEGADRAKEIEEQRKVLAEYGSDGWELVSVSAQRWGYSDDEITVLYFKRQRT